MNHISIPQASHELRNYLAGISGLVDIIAENITDFENRQKARGERLDDNLVEISEVSKMLAPYSSEALKYVEDLLDISQGQDSKLSLGQLQECDLEELIGRLLIFCKFLTIKHKVTINTKIEPNLPKLKTDIIRLKQILINLITNAIKYSPENSCINIEVGLTLDQKIKISVIDHGIGMTGQEVKMALNGQGKEIDKSSLNKEIDSHGIGMPIIKQFVELIGAEMKIESEKAKGSNFTLNFSI